MAPWGGTAAAPDAGVLDAWLLGADAGLLVLGSLEGSLGTDVVIALLTALSSKTGVWFAEASGELVNSIAYFHDAANTDAPGVAADQRGDPRPAGHPQGCGLHRHPHLFSTTLHRKWRGWLNGRFNEALLDTNHTHFHLQHGAGDRAAPAPDNIDQRIQESIKGMTGGAIGLAMGVAGVATSLFFVGQKLLEISTEVAGSSSSATTAARSWPSRQSPSMCR